MPEQSRLYKKKTLHKWNIIICPGTEPYAVQSARGIHSTQEIKYNISSILYQFSNAIFSR